MKYLELIVEFDRSLREELLAELISAGYSSFAINDPEDLRDIKEHPEWYKYDYIDESLADEAGRRKPSVSLYFPADEEGSRELERAESVLKMFKNDDKEIAWQSEETADDSSWLYKWQENFEPAKVGERFVVKPSWEDYTAEPGELVIEMDPGMAFGSGLHETTSLCIKALEKSLHAVQDNRNSRSDDINYYSEYHYSRFDNSNCHSEEAKRSKKLSVLDIGTGTGILAIAAAMLGAECCLGIDIDADAVRVAKENVQRNGLSDRIEIREGDLAEGVDFGADIILANLMADLVIRLAPAAAEQLAPGGIFISSGILDTKEEVVAEAVRDAGFEINNILRDGEWCAIVAKRV